MALAMMICCYLWEHSLRWLFPAKMPSLRPRQRRRLTKELVSKKVKWVICRWEGVRVIHKNQVVGNLCSTSKAYAVCYHCLPCNKYMQNWKELQCTCGQVSLVTDYSTWVGYRTRGFVLCRSRLLCLGKELDHPLWVTLVGNLPSCKTAKHWTFGTIVPEEKQKNNLWLFYKSPQQTPIWGTPNKWCAHDAFLLYKNFFPCCIKRSAKFRSFLTGH